MRQLARIGIEAATALLVPPLCPACGRPGELGPAAPLCGRCRRSFARLPPQAPALPPGVEIAAGGRLPLLAAVPYRGPAVGLVGALKSGRIPGAAAIAAELIAEALGSLPTAPPPALVPVGAARLRRLRRGLDPAAEIALALAAGLGLECLPGLLRRLDSRPQRGRRRAARLADPPSFGLRGVPPARVLLVDDVITTGATVASCAGALRSAGAVVDGAISFAWTPAPADT